MSRLANGLRFVPGDEGDVWYRASNGDMVHLARPSDYAAMETAGTPYRLGIDPATGLPYWVATPIAGVGTSPVTVSDGAGGFLLVFDNDGNVVYA